MRQSTKFIFISIFIIFLGGCATGGRISYERLPLKEINFDETKGYVYFYRPCMVFGAARGINISDSDRAIGGLNCSTYFIHEVEPGTHRFHADDWLREKQILEIDVKPGQEYYVKADLRIGILDAIPSLTLMDSSVKGTISELKRVPSY